MTIVAPVMPDSGGRGCGRENGFGRNRQRPALDPPQSDGPVQLLGRLDDQNARAGQRKAGAETFERRGQPQQIRRANGAQ